VSFLWQKISISCFFFAEDLQPKPPTVVFKEQRQQGLHSQPNTKKIPEMKKARIINRTPMMNLKIPSPFPTFFTFTAGFPS
jgi:hypothetical protein